MEKIYSKTNQPWLLLHIIHRAADIVQQRNDLVPTEQYIQVSSLSLPQDKTFVAHKHILKDPPFHRVRAQESWVIIKGKVKCILYDIDDSIIAERELNPGDCSITLMGGHNYVALEPSIIYEFKTGPYEGQEKDKVFI